MSENKGNQASFKLPNVLLCAFLASLLLTNASFAVCFMGFCTPDPVQKAKEEIQNSTGVDPNNPQNIVKKEIPVVPVETSVDFRSHLYPDKYKEVNGKTVSIKDYKNPEINPEPVETSVDFRSHLYPDKYKEVNGETVSIKDYKNREINPEPVETSVDFRSHLYPDKYKEVNGETVPIKDYKNRDAHPYSNDHHIDGIICPDASIGRQGNVSESHPACNHQPGDSNFVGPVDTRNGVTANNSSVEGAQCGTKLWGGYKANCKPTKVSPGLLDGVNLGGMFQNAAIAAAVDMAQKAIRGEKIDIGGTLKTLGAGIAGSLANQVAYNAAKEAFGHVGASVIAGAVGSGVGTAVRGGNVGSAALGGAVGSFGSAVNSGIRSATGSSALGAAAGGAATAALSGGDVFSAATQGAVNATAQGLATDIFAKAHGQVPPVITTPTSNTLNTITRANPVPPSMPTVKVPVKYSGLPGSGVV